MQHHHAHVASCAAEHRISCFQNRRLARGVAHELRREGFGVFVNSRVPVNNGGISYGQAAIAAARR